MPIHTGVCVCVCVFTERFLSDGDISVDIDVTGPPVITANYIESYHKVTCMYIHGQSQMRSQHCQTSIHLADSVLDISAETAALCSSLLAAIQTINSLCFTLAWCSNRFHQCVRSSLNFFFNLPGADQLQQQIRFYQ